MNENRPPAQNFDPERRLFRDFLATKGLRITRERLALFYEIFGNHRHFDAEQLLRLMQRKHRKISRATVYRTLDLLVAAGLVSRQRFAGEEYQYEHVHPGEHHDHLVCLTCQRVIEFSNDEIERLQDEVCARYGFRPERHTHRIEGRCAECLDAGQKDAAQALPRRSSSSKSSRGPADRARS